MGGQAKIVTGLGRMTRRARGRGAGLTVAPERPSVRWSSVSDAVWAAPSSFIETDISMPKDGCADPPDPSPAIDGHETQVAAPGKAVPVPESSAESGRLPPCRLAACASPSIADSKRPMNPRAADKMEIRKVSLNIVSVSHLLFLSPLVIVG